ncbi:hypothetical protein SAMN07250955_105154 [Arboricoccus pini]|uniref:Uncharacterized protein n=1 Tax=Arboricoccus pini TaxID=1963835 RepID=A0A212R492_9PROT|nr:hypothetical protein SAMN07250955_105154 [Arboricoccus pini]
MGSRALREGFIFEDANHNVIREVVRINWTVISDEQRDRGQELLRKIKASESRRCANLKALTGSV